MKHKLWIVAKEVYRKNVQTWAFVFMVLSPILMFLISGGIGYFIGQDAVNSTQGTVAIIGLTPEQKQHLTQSDSRNVYQFLANQEEAEQALLDKTIDGYAVVEHVDNQSAVTYYREKTAKDIELSELTSSLADYQTQQQLTKLGISEEQLQQTLNQNVPIQTVHIAHTENGWTQEVEDGLAKGIKIGAAALVAFLVFIFTLNYATIIAQEVATEKGSRIMEIVLSSVSSTTHFLGKMLGIFLVVLTQFAIYLVVFGVFYIAFGRFDIGLDDGVKATIFQAFEEVKPTLGIALLYALIGMLTYIMLAGFVGTLVSRTEDAQKVIAPLTFISIPAIYIAQYSFISSNNIVVKLGSHFPLWTPFIMPFRMAQGTVSTFEIVLSFGISIIFMIMCLILALLFYKSNVLVYSDKGAINTLKQSYRLWKQERETNVQQ
ncbi:MAG: ABC transporter permease [Aerococcaceae bacterium]|nr:ABC transporter permease [Aerococcaceae bacterium]